MIFMHSQVHPAPEAGLVALEVLPGLGALLGSLLFWQFFG